MYSAVDERDVGKRGGESQKKDKKVQLDSIILELRKNVGKGSVAIKMHISARVGKWK